MRIIDPVDRPPRGWFGRHRTKQLRLVAQRRQMRQRVPTARSASTRPGAWRVGTVLYVSSSAVVHPAANPVSTVNSRNSNAPARDTNPVPSALTLTRPVRRLLFTYGVPSCVVALDLLKPKFPL